MNTQNKSQQPKFRWAKRKIFIAILLAEFAIATGAGIIDPVWGFLVDAGIVVLHVVAENNEKE